MTEETIAADTLTQESVEREEITAPAPLDAAILVDSDERGWWAKVRATLPDGGCSQGNSPIYPTRGEAIVHAAENLVLWCSDEKVRGKHKHQRAAARLQQWALDVARREHAAVPPQEAMKSDLCACGASTIIVIEGPMAGLVICPVCKPDEVQRYFGSIFAAMDAGDQAEAAGAAAYEEAATGGLVGAEDLAPGTADDQIAPPEVDAIRERLTDSHARVTGEPVVITVQRSEIHEHPLNPRRIFPLAKLEELAASMRSEGFRSYNPFVLFVREDGGYWLGAGARRLRAMDLAGLTEAPAFVRPYDRAKLLDVLNFDNSGREDVHPLHEAAGWHQLIAEEGHTVEQIAARVGQSESYVYMRLKYADLIPEAGEAFLDGRIGRRIAELIARRPAHTQRAAMQWLFPAWDPDREISTREFEEWLKKHCDRSLISVPFDTANPELHGGSCRCCPKRSGFAPEMFPDIEDPQTCTDAKCYQAKVAEYQASAPLLTPPEPKPVAAPAAEPKPEPVAEEKQTETDTAKEDQATDLRKKEKAWADHAKREREKQAAEQEKIRAVAQRFAERRKRIYRKTVEAVASKVKCPATQEDLLALADFIVESSDGCEEVAEMYRAPAGRLSRASDLAAILPHQSTDTLLRIAIVAILFDRGAAMDWGENTLLVSLKRRHKINDSKIEEQVDAEMNPRPADPRKAAIKKLPTVQDKTARRKSGPATSKPVKPPVKAVVKKVTSKGKGKK